jgi:6-pyruvoyltetrahydropterin/6-carboxytetrahydropterin synthase
MEAEVIKTFHFEAAHDLPNTPPGHKCRNLHGHSYRVDVHVTGPVDPRSGWVIDFGEIKRIVDPIIAELDHRYLNKIPGLENSTSELMAAWLFNRIRPALSGLSAITVWESDNSRATYRE